MRKYTIAQFNKEFPDDDACLEWLRNKFYPSKIYCPICKKPTKHHRIRTKKVYGCDFCGHQISPMAGTIFEHSPTSLKHWFYAIFLMSATRCGISAKQIQRETGVTYKTAWRMFRQIRMLLEDKPKPVFGEVEMDETYIGGRRSGPPGRGAKGKTPVIGLAERQGKVRALKTKDVKGATVYRIVRRNIVANNTTIYTDDYPVYDQLKWSGFKHKTVEHGLKVWVMGDAHTNTIEGFWSLLKRGINGVYHAVSEKYLQHYINEYSFRYNHRNDEKPMFESVLAQIAKF